MSNTTTVTGFEALAIVHPQHATIISEAQAVMGAGAIVAIETVGLTNTGTFFTGVRSGDRVVVTDFTSYASSESRSVSRIGLDAASLGVNSGHRLVEVDPNTLTAEEAKTAQQAATKAATHLMEKALCSANGLLGAPAGDEAALVALREAHTLRNLAFAYGVLVDWIDGMAGRGDVGYFRNTLARAQR